MPTVLLSRFARRLGALVAPVTPLTRTAWEGKLGPVQLRRVGPDDVEACLELYRLNEPGRFPPGQLPGYFKCLAKQEAYFLGVEGTKGLVATCGLALVERRNHLAIACYGLVHPEHHGKGLGTAMLLARLAMLDPRRLGFFVHMNTVADSMTFYRRSGFAPGGTWQDQSGAKHPTADRFLFGYQITRIRRLLDRHGITFPQADASIIPYIAPPRYAVNQSG
jgi:GNAT superfamily N-acetyltransferase